MTKRLSITIGLVLFYAALLNSQGLHAAAKLENVEWRPMELQGTAVAPIPGAKKPSILFDENKQTASGYNGCNDFFGHYETQGETLTFGPITSTNRICPAPESDIETRFMHVIDSAHAWQIQNGNLSLLNIATVLARFVQPDAEPADLDSLTVHSTVYTEKPVTLIQGTYRTPAPPGTKSETSVKLTSLRAFGSAYGKPIGAVVLATSTGDSKTFYELALLAKTADGWVNTDTAFLGDRINVESVAIQGSRVVLAMKTLARGDQPSREVPRQFLVQHGQLQPPPVTASLMQEHLVGGRWQWLQTQYNNTKPITPPASESYTVQFLDGGQLTIDADCNLDNGTYILEHTSLSIAIVSSSRLICEPGSLEDQFIRDISAGTGYSFQNGDLIIRLSSSNGTMILSPLNP